MQTSVVMRTMIAYLVCVQASPTKYQWPERRKRQDRRVMAGVGQERLQKSWLKVLQSATQAASGSIGHQKLMPCTVSQGSAMQS